MLLGAFAIFGLAGTAGYFICAALVTPEVVAKPPNDPKIDDLPLLRNLPLYQHVNDLDFLRELDTPDLFGDGSTGS